MSAWPESRVELDLNNPVFQSTGLGLDKAERRRLVDTLKKIIQLRWEQLTRDPGLKWEKISSVKAPAGIDALYSLRITKARRATAYRQGNVLRLLTVQPDHNAAYDKK